MVIFDRLRENLIKYKTMPLRDVMNLSVNETLSRTLMTSGTTLLALIALLVLGGDVIRGFVFAITWGVVVGTYSSVYVAKNIVLMLGVKRDWSKPDARPGQPVRQHGCLTAPVPALAAPGLGSWRRSALMAGMVYGFAGFGSALIFMPVATVLISPILAVASFSIASMSALVIVLPRALREADRRATMTMLAAAFVMLPLGVFFLRTSDPTVLRWAVSLVVLVTLAALITGWRYRQTPGLRSWLAVGGGVGFLGGSVGLNGPAMVLFQLGGQDSVTRSRANTIVVLSLSSLAYVPMIALQGALPSEAIGLGLILLPAYASRRHDRQPPV